MKKNVAVLFVLFVFFSLSAQALTVGLVLDKGGRDDKSFNASAFAGAKKAEQELGIKLKVVESSDDNSFEPLMRAFAQRNFDLIVAVGLSQADALRKIAPQFPKAKFAIVDAEVQAANVRSLLFEEHEGSYLVGAVAALKSKSHILGFIGGMDIPLIRRFAMGYEAGAKKIDPKIKVLNGYVGITGDAWNNPPKSKELGLAQYKQGADVIFVAAGASNSGAFDAAEEAGKFAIGVDSNQNWMKPGRILTSMLKRVDLAVYGACKDVLDGKFEAGVKRHGLVGGGIDLALDEHNKNLMTPEILEKVKNLREEITKGKIKVPDYYKSPKR